MLMMSMKFNMSWSGHETRQVACGSGRRFLIRALARACAAQESGSGCRRLVVRGPGQPPSQSSGRRRAQALPNSLQRVCASVPDGYSPQVICEIGRGSVGQHLPTRGLSIPQWAWLALGCPNTHVALPYPPRHRFLPNDPAPLSPRGWDPGAKMTMSTPPSTRPRRATCPDRRHLACRARSPGSRAMPPWLYEHSSKTWNIWMQHTFEANETFETYTWNMCVKHIQHLDKTLPTCNMKTLPATYDWNN
jgi:hypothetical protein